MWSTVRQEFADDLRFCRLGEQWPENIRKERDLDGRPCLTINRLPAFTRQVVNDARQNKPQIKVRPADGGADVRTAEVFGGIIRNIESVSKAQIAYDTGVDMAVNGGFGFWRIDLEYVNDFSFDLEPRINRIANPLTVYFDPMTQAADSSDWRYCFVADMMPKTEFEAQFPEAKFSSFSDDDKNFPWVDESSETIRVAEWWRRQETTQKILQLSNGMVVYAAEYEKPETRALFDMQGVTVQRERMVPAYRVTQQLVTGAQVLDDERSWIGSFIPVVPCYGDEVNVEGKRYFRSMIRDAKDSQKMVNFWRTTTTELVALAPRAPWIGEEGAFQVDAEKWATANTRSHSTLEYKKGTQRPQREPFDGVPAGALQEALNASDDMKAILGIFDPSLGQRSNETSGKAIIARQRESDTSTFNFIDNLTRAVEHTGRILVDIIPKLYTESKIIRILGEDGKPMSVKVGPSSQQPGTPLPTQAPGAAQQPPAPDQPQEQPGAPLDLTRIYDLNAGRYDVVVQAGPSFTTKRDESAQQMLAFTQAFPAAGPVMGDVLVKALDWPDAEKVAARFQKMLPPALQDNPPPQQEGPPPEVQAMQMKTQAEIEAANAKAANDIKLANEKAANDRQNSRLKAIADAETKREVAMIEAATQRDIALRQPPPMPQPTAP